LELETRDPLLQLKEPLEFNLLVEQVGAGLLVRGKLRLPIHCECVRCLKPFVHFLELGDWVCHVPLEGEESAPVVGDLVDLTPYVREDIVLAFPQHPLCESECNGLPGLHASDEGAQSVEQTPAKAPGSIWDQLDKLKLS